MDIQQKLELLEKESLQLRLQLMTNDIQLFDYYQLTLLSNQIDIRMELLKQQMDDMKQDQEHEQQLRQIKATKERAKRPSTKLEKVDKVMMEVLYVILLRLVYSFHDEQKDEFIAKVINVFPDNPSKKITEGSIDLTRWITEGCFIQNPFQL